jgi:hypothetical protein
MSQQNNKKQNATSQRSLKSTLANSGFNEDITNKIWKWYNPPELKVNKFKNNSGN